MISRKDIRPNGVEPSWLVLRNEVTERTHEIGVRMALGAQRGDVLRLMLARGLILTAIGLAIGLGLSYALARMLSNLIVGVSATDVMTFGSVMGLLAFVALGGVIHPCAKGYTSGSADCTETRVDRCHTGHGKDLGSLITIEKRGIAITDGRDSQLTLTGSLVVTIRNELSAR